MSDFAANYAPGNLPPCGGDVGLPTEGGNPAQTSPPSVTFGDISPTRGEIGRVFAFALFVATTLCPVAAHAACPQELAIYEDSAGNALTFTPPRENQAAEYEFKFRLGLTELQGIVLWSKDPDRPNGMIMDQCPDGDVTGEEIDACTVWQGVIYGLTKDATAPYLGKRGTPFAEALLLPDFSRSAMEHTFKTPLPGPVKSDDVFRMKGCQE